jgi:hypothetical protein
MPKAADPGSTDDPGLRRRWALVGPAHRRILQHRVDSLLVVVVEVFREKASKMVLVRDGHVIGLFA